MSRVRDLVLCVLAILALTPALLLIALLVRLESSGPALFKQQRVGRYGRPFTLYKFRTMRADASGPLVTASSDDRITRVGAVLRRSKLDELPQLWNVIRGDMSLVGPRPEVARYVALIPDALRDEILSVLPGVTDPTTARLRDEERLLAGAADPERVYAEVLLPIKAREQAAYTLSRSFGSDCAVLLRTLRAIVWPSPRADGPEGDDRYVTASPSTSLGDPTTRGDGQAE